MKLLLYVALSTAMRMWYEREKRRNLPTMVAERIDFDQLRVHIRAK